MTISIELENWAKLAGYSLTAGAQGGAEDMFWNQGGEIRYSLKEESDGWVEVTCSDRLGPYYFYFAGKTVDVVEKFFFGSFGNALRDKRDMPMLATPISENELASGYRIARRHIGGFDRYVLIDPRDSMVAIASGGKVSAESDLVPLSIYMDVPAVDIIQSFMNEDGRPLFTVL